MSLDYEYPYTAHFYSQNEGKSLEVQVRLDESEDFYLDSEETMIHLNDERFIHSEHGPAITYADGSMEWWINGHEVTKEEFGQYVARKQLKDSLQSDLEEKETKGQRKL